MARLSVAVIGVGNMGQHHARTYFEIPQANLVAVCDTDTERGTTLARKYNCLFFTDYRKMLTDLKISAVSVAVPTVAHHQCVCDLLDMGVHILLEKPIATGPAEARDIMAKAKEKKLRLMVGHIERFNPAVRRLKGLIADRRLGDIVSINIKRVGGLPPQREDANVLIDLAIHDIDISNHVLGEYPCEVYGFKSRNLINDLEDSAVLLLKYAKASSFIEVNWVTPVKIRTMDITGTKAFARVDYINQTITLYENTFLSKDNQYDDFDEFVSKFSMTDEVRIGVEKKEPLRCELEEFIAAIREDREPFVTDEEACRALEIALKA